MAFLDILPDPNTRIRISGKVGANTVGSETGTAGPGFASVQLTSDAKVMRTSTNSGRLIARGIAGHKWKINISYNPMTRAEFEPVYNFLLQKRGGLIPFYVSLPQYKVPQNAALTTNMDVKGAVIAGSTQLLLDGDGYDITASAEDDGYPSPGDLFTVTDSSDSNHTKAYRVVRCETPSDYVTTVSDDHVRIHISPPLAKAVSDNAEVVFQNPLIKVVLAKDLQQYSLNTNNLYKFSLNLEEAQ